MDNSMQNDGELKLKRIQVLFYALFSSVVFYFIVCEYLARYVFTPEKPGFAYLPDAQFSILKTALIALSIVEASVITAVGMGIRNGEKNWAVKIMLGSILGANADEYITLQNAMISMTSFSTSITIYGLVLFLMRGNRLDAYPFMAAGLLLLLFFRPERGMLEKLKTMKGN